MKPVIDEIHKILIFAMPYDLLREIIVLLLSNSLEHFKCVFQFPLHWLTLTNQLQSCSEHQTQVVKSEVCAQL